MNALFGEKLQMRLFALVLPQAFIFVALQAIREAQTTAPMAYSLFFIAQGALLVFAGIRAQWCPGEEKAVNSAPKLAFVAMTGTGPLVISIGTAFESPALVLIGSAASGISQAISYLQCFRLYTAFPMRPRIAFTTICFALAPALRLPLVFAPMAIRCAIATSFPLGCLALCQMSKNATTTHSTSNTAGNPRRKAKRFAPYFAVIALFGFSLGCFYAPFDSGVMGTAAYASASLKTIILIAILWLFMTLFDRIAVDHLCQIIVLVVLLALAIAAQFGSHDPWSIAAATADLTWYVMVALLYVLLIALADHSKLAPSTLFAFGWTPYLLAKVAGTATAEYLQKIDGVGFLILLPLCLIGGVVMVFLNIRRDTTDFLFAFDSATPSKKTPSPSNSAINEESPSPIPREKELQRNQQDREALDRIAARFALTERERETMAFIHQGYSKRAIAEKLFLSQNTVRTHARTLYAKLGIHSRDDLLDLVQEENQPTSKEPNSKK